MADDPIGDALTELEAEFAKVIGHMRSDDADYCYFAFVAALAKLISDFHPDNSVAASLAPLTAREAGLGK